MEMSAHLRRVSASMRLPSCEDEHHPCDVLEEELDAFWSQDAFNGKFHRDTRETSLEKQFLSGDILCMPVAPTITTHRKTSLRHEPGCIVRGEDINDIPTSYVINGLKSSEIPVIGTYVDRRIVPGFRYRVRLNQSTRYLFGGRPLHLESIGSGYGKRLTFESSSRNSNNNYFWSDSQPEGYGFKPVALWEGDRVTLTREVPGGPDHERQVDIIACISQTEVDTKVKDFGEIEKRFQVKFLCRPVEGDDGSDRALLVVAIAVLVKSKGRRTAQVQRLLLATQCSVRASSFVRNV